MTGYVVLMAGLGSSSAQECLIRATAEESSSIFDMKPLSERRFLIGARDGVFEFSGVTGQLSKVSGAQTISDVFAVEPLGEGRFLIGAEQQRTVFDGQSGLLAFEGQGDLFLYIDATREFMSIHRDQDTGSVLDVKPFGDRRFLIPTEGALYRFVEPTGEFTRMKAQGHPGVVFAIESPVDGRFLVLAEDRWSLTARGEHERYLYHFIEPTGEFTKVDHQEETGGVSAIECLENGQCLVGTLEGLYEFVEATGELKRVNHHEDTGAVYEIECLENRQCLIGTSEGLYEFAAVTGQFTKVVTSEDMEFVTDVEPLGDGRFLINAAADYFLFIRATGELKKVGDAEGTEKVTTSEPLGNRQWLIGTRWGVYRLVEATGRLEKLEAAESTGTVFAIQPFEDGRFLVATWAGLFVTPRTSIRDAEVTPPENVRSAGKTVTKWVVKHPCAFEVELFRPEISTCARGENPRRSFSTATRIETPESLHDATLIADVELETRGAYELQMWMTLPSTGERVTIGTPTTVLIDFSLLDYVRELWPWIAIGGILLHTVCYVVLFAGARRSAWCFRVISDPLWGKAGLLFYFSHSRFRFIQLWLFERYFQRQRREIQPRQYLPMPLLGARKDCLEPSKILGVLNSTSRLWIQGNTGMGKTALVNEAHRQYFGGEITSLRDGVRRFGYVPIFVACRHYESLAVQSDEPGAWVREAARGTLAAAEMPFEDRSLFKSILESGVFAIVLDGVNEVGREEDARLFARTSPSVRLLVTSQTLGGDPFVEYRLPADIAEYVDPLLRLYLGNDRGSAVYHAVAASGLLASLGSGYDVRLIGDLVTRAPEELLPTDRLGLYRTMLLSARLPDGSAYPEEDVCRLAWDLWRSGERQLKRGQHLPDGRLNPLLADGSKVLRSTGEAMYEFRHDQMRAYLAARWLAEHAASTDVMLSWLDDPQVWRLGRKEQEEMFVFLADMIGPAETLKKIWCFAAEGRERVVLQHAIQSVALRKHIRLVLAPQAQASHDPRDS